MKKLLIFFLLVSASVSAVTRPDWLQIASAPVYDCRLSGVIANDGLDDSAALQAAINFVASTTSPFNTLLLPEGTVDLATGVIIPWSPNHKSITIMGRKLPTYGVASGSTHGSVMMGRVKNQGVITIPTGGDYTNVTLSDFAILNSSPIASTAIGVDMTQTYGFTIERVGFGNLFYGIYSRGSGVTNSINGRIRECWFYGVGHCITSTQSDFNDLQIDRNLMVESLYSILNLGNTTEVYRSISFQNNDMAGATTMSNGILIQGCVAALNISNNYFEFQCLHKPLISIGSGGSKCRGVTIFGNHIGGFVPDVGSAVVELGTTEGFTATGNSFEQTTAAGTGRFFIEDKNYAMINFVIDLPGGPSATPCGLTTLKWQGNSYSNPHIVYPRLGDASFELQDGSVGTFTWGLASEYQYRYSAITATITLGLATPTGTICGDVTVFRCPSAAGAGDIKVLNQTGGVLTTLIGAGKGMRAKWTQGTWLLMQTW